MNVDVQPHPFDPPDAYAAEGDRRTDFETGNRIAEHDDHSKLAREEIHSAEGEDRDYAERERPHYEAADNEGLGPHHELPRLCEWLGSGPRCMKACTVGCAHLSRST